MAHGKNDYRFADLRAEAVALGGREADGTLARIELAMKLFEGSRDGVIEMDTPKGQVSHVEVLFDAFGAAKAARLGTIREETKASRKSQLCKMNVFARYGATKGYDTTAQLVLCRSVLETECVDVKGGTFDNLLVFMRAEIQAGVALTREEIVHVFIPPANLDEPTPAAAPREEAPRADRPLTEGDVLADLLMRATEAAKAFPSAEIEAVRLALHKRLGGLIAAEAMAEDAKVEAEPPTDIVDAEFSEIFAGLLPPPVNVIPFQAAA